MTSRKTAGKFERFEIKEFASISYITLAKAVPKDPIFVAKYVNKNNGL